MDVWALSLGCIIGWGAFVMPGTTFLPVAGYEVYLSEIGISVAVLVIVALLGICCGVRFLFGLIYER